MGNGRKSSSPSAKHFYLVERCIVVEGIFCALLLNLLREELLGLSVRIEEFVVGARWIENLASIVDFFTLLLFWQLIYFSALVF